MGVTCPKSPHPPWSPGSNRAGTVGFAGILADVTRLVEERQNAGWGKVGRAPGDSV